MNCTNLKKVQLVLFSVKRFHSNHCKTVSASYGKQLDDLMIRKQTHNGSNNNPDSFIINRLLS